MQNDREVEKLRAEREEWRSKYVDERAHREKLEKEVEKLKKIVKQLSDEARLREASEQSSSSRVNGVPRGNFAARNRDDKAMGSRWAAGPPTSPRMKSQHVQLKASSTLGSATDPLVPPNPPPAPAPASAAFPPNAEPAVPAPTDSKVGSYASIAASAASKLEKVKPEKPKAEKAKATARPASAGPGARTSAIATQTRAQEPSETSAPVSSEEDRMKVANALREASMARDAQKLREAIEMAERMQFHFEADQGRRRLAKLL